MNKQFAGLEIRRDDIKALYDSIEEPWMMLSDGCYDWFNDMRVCRHGIYLWDPEEGGQDPIGLSNEEREALTRHPTDDYVAPLLKLPSTLGTFESFIDRYDLPAPDGFRLLVWIDKHPDLDAQPPAVNPSPPTDGGRGVTVNLPHLNKALKKIFEVMWANWGDPSQKRPPRQVSVQEDLDKALSWHPGQDGKPSRGAVTVAALLKPDQQPTVETTSPGTGHRVPGT
jgi:hypothetical protein